MTTCYNWHHTPTLYSTSNWHRDWLSHLAWGQIMCPQVQHIGWKASWQCCLHPQDVLEAIWSVIVLSSSVSPIPSPPCLFHDHQQVTRSICLLCQLGPALSCLCPWQTLCCSVTLHFRSQDQSSLPRRWTGHFNFQCCLSWGVAAYFGKLHSSLLIHIPNFPYLHSQHDGFCGIKVRGVW